MCAKNARFHEPLVPVGDALPDRVGMILLQIVDPIAEVDGLEVLQLRLEAFGDLGRDDRAWAGVEHELGQLRFLQPLPIVSDDFVHVGRGPTERDLARPLPDRFATGHGPERRAVRLHLFWAEPAPYWKDYDALEAPLKWADRFNLSKWGLLGAFHDRRRVGGALIAFDSEEVEMLEGRKDLAVLWDLRVEPSSRRRGVGTALFRAVEDWAASRGCAGLRIETQNSNVPACRFYERQGCELRQINPGAYAALLHEVQLLWEKVPRGL